ncbi:uncharacterized protein LOC111626575 isoform X2 [Centruroides sculpturatus]|uniref:uncharacterized protein LOC111626575 isoform X2 n=1 Tax=Centruroides sculpturatus TaxID=218467 RepID=UPI000C6CD44B|nr:uncharacterized protein LOC111626575 isoform X2 [Centruroides sculpturatus]
MRNGFVAQIEINNRPQDESIYVTEYYFAAKNLTRVEIIRKGKVESVFFYPTQDQIVVLKDDACRVEKAGSSDYLLNYNFTNWLYSPGGKTIYFGPTSLLRSGADNPQMQYVGKDTVEGIRCHKFNGDYWANDDIQVDYFFSEENWATPTNVSRQMVPIRVRLYGKGKPMEDSDEGMFEQTLDYIMFRTFVFDSRMLRPPSGYGCPGLRNQGPDPPARSGKFFVSGEFRNLTDDQKNNRDTIVPFRLWYHYDRKLARLDVRGGPDGSKSTVYDFNTGMMYITADRKCDAFPVRGQTLESFEDGLIGSMKKPKEILGGEGDFYYLGQSYVRGMLCDVWESVIPKSSEEKKGPARTVYTYYFTNHYWSVAVDGKVEGASPVRVEVADYDDGGVGVRLIYNLFAYDKFPTFRFGPFDVSDCEGVPSRKSYFLITFSGSDETVTAAEDVAAVVREELRTSIPTKAQVSSLRLPFLRVDFEPGIISVLGLLTERVPALKRFEESDEHDKPRESEKEVQNVDSDEDCAQFCVEADKCTGFHVCGRRCFLANLDLTADWGKKMDVDDCAFYIRVEAGTSAKDVPLNQAMSNLKEAVDKKKLVIVIEGDDGEITLNPEEFVGDISPFQVGDRDSDMFEKVLSGKTFKKPENSQIVVDGGELSTPSDCYRKCRDEKTMQCFSFSFCFTDNRCLLSPLYVSQSRSARIDDDIDTVGGCDVYTVSYLRMFVAYEGAVSSLPGRKEKTGVASDNECAKLCREEEEFVCRGFEYCRSDKICQLHEKHVLETKDPLVQTGKICTHYALKYAADYVESGRLKLLDPDAETLTVSSLEECAASCSEKSEFPCASFDLCSINSDQKSCVLNSRTLEQLDTKSEASSSCRHYTKKDVVDDWARPRVAEKSSQSTGYTSIFVNTRARIQSVYRSKN